jgi:chloramphenicol-sensitive protein RarD
MKHYAAAIGAFVVWGFFAIPLRALMDFSAGQILYFRIMFSLGVLAIVVAGFRRASFVSDIQKFKDLNRGAKQTVIMLTLGGGALLTVNWLSFIYIVNNINVKTASFSYLICPVFTAVLGFLLLKEKITALQWFAVAMCAVSCVLMGISSALELGYSLFTAVTYALYLISQRKNQGFDRMVMLAIQTLFSFLLLTVFVNQLAPEIPTSTRFYTIILVIAIFFTVLPLFLNLFALNKINSATIGILMYLNPLFNFTIAFVVFHESINSIQVVGYIIIGIALIVFNYPNVSKIRSAVNTSISK